MKNFIIFRTDRLGDFLIITSIIKAIKKKFVNSHITVIGSPLNANIIKSYKSINEVIIYDKKSSLSKKFEIFNKIKSKSYYCSLSLDGKSFSNFINFFLKANIKIGISYRFYLLNFFIKIIWSKPNILYNYFVFDKFIYFTSKKSLTKVEHLPSILLKLLNFLNLNLSPKDPYYFEIKKKNISLAKLLYKKKIKRNFVLIHLDEKWEDINNIDDKLFDEINSFQKQIKKKIVISSNKNKSLYYNNLKIKYKMNKNIVLLENLNLDIFERIISMSTFAISCHSGFLVQISGFNKTNIIDIINERDLTWYKSWKPLNTKHKFVFKSNLKRKNTLKYLFNRIIIESKKFK
jgi:ADP-heptose:LPS heptosyltransferase